MINNLGKLLVLMFLTGCINLYETEYKTSRPRVSLNTTLNGLLFFNEDMTENKTLNIYIINNDKIKFHNDSISFDTFDISYKILFSTVNKTKYNRFLVFHKKFSFKSNIYKDFCCYEKLNIINGEEQYYKFLPVSLKLNKISNISGFNSCESLEKGSSIPLYEVYVEELKIENVTLYSNKIININNPFSKDILKK